LNPNRTHLFLPVLSFLLVLTLLGGFLALSFSSLHWEWHWDSVWAYREKFLRGWLSTLLLSGATLALSLPLGLALTLGRLKAWLPVRQLCTLIVEVIRGTPLLVQILVLFYIVGSALGLENRFFAGILILSLFEAAYFSEIFRGAWLSLPQSTLTSARAIGLTPRDTFTQVITPLALRNCLPSLASQTASLIKDSSLLSIIAVTELTHVAQEINAFTYSTLESYLPLAFAYVLLTAPLSFLTRRWEKSLAYAN
jgi:polar amino acid transport system permease protein